MYKNVFNFTILPTPQKCQNEKNSKSEKDVEQLKLSYTAVGIYTDFITWKNCLAISANMAHTQSLSSF